MKLPALLLSLLCALSAQGQYAVRFVPPTNAIESKIVLYSAAYWETNATIAGTGTSIGICSVNSSNVIAIPTWVQHPVLISVKSVAENKESVWSEPVLFTPDVPEPDVTEPKAPTRMEVIKL